MDVSGDLHNPATITMGETSIDALYIKGWEGRGFSGRHEEEINTRCS
jgi:hypothetical protein